MTEKRRIDDRLPEEPLQWDDATSQPRTLKEHLAAAPDLDALDSVVPPLTAVAPMTDEVERLRAQVEQLQSMLENRVQYKPDNSQSWENVDGAVAFHLIERHADNWNDAGRMMEAWSHARNKAAPATPGQAAEKLQSIADELEDASAPYGGDFADAVNGCVEALRELVTPVPTEEMVRFCPHCASIGEIGAEYRDCCPDGSAARHIPRKLAEVCRDTFKLAIGSVAAPVQAEQAQADEILALHRQLAAEKLRADQGWERAEAKSKECIEIRERLAALPAQVEPSEEAAYYKQLWQQARTELYRRTFPAQAEQAAAVRAVEWVSVDDRLPEIPDDAPKYATKVRVLAVVPSGHVKEMQYAINSYAKTEKGRVPRWEESDGRLAFNNPTHWTPLPAAPSTTPSNDTSALGDTGGAK